MALTYNLKYKKLNFFHKVLLEKEGEIVVDRHGFRLKGKGAGDMGEIVYFSDMKDMVIGDDELRFATYRKERFVLNNFSNLFSSFLKDFFRVRNEWLAETFQMKVGMLYHEYEGHVDIINRFGTQINRGKARLQLYEGSLLVIPEQHDCFAIYFNFLKNHEFDEDEYTLKLYLDTGAVVQVSKLGTTFEDMQETLESLLGKMYERLLHHLQEALPGVDAGDLIKLATLVREGKCVLQSSLKKIDPDLPSKIEELIFAKSSTAIKEKVQLLRSMSKTSEFYSSFAFFSKPDRELDVKGWFLVALPEYNVVALGESSNPRSESIYFFRIMMESGDVNEKLRDKILEINQSLYLTRFDFGPLYRDKYDFKKSKYKLFFKKITFLRLLRKSFVGKIFAGDMTSFKKECERIFISAKKFIGRNVSEKPHTCG